MQSHSAEKEKVKFMSQGVHEGLGWGFRGGVEAEEAGLWCFFTYKLCPSEEVPSFFQFNLPKATFTMIFKHGKESQYYQAITYIGVFHFLTQVSFLIAKCAAKERNVQIWTYCYNSSNNFPFNFPCQNTV